MKTFNRHILIVIVCLMVLLIPFAYVTFYMPVHVQLETEVLKSYQLLTHSKQQLLAAQMERAIDNAKGLSQANATHFMLEAYERGTTTLSYLKQYTEIRFLNHIKSMPSVRYATRYVDGSPLVSYQTEEVVLRPLTSAQLSLYYDAEKKQIHVINPIESNGQILGYDYVVYDATEVLAEVRDPQFELSLLEGLDYPSGIQEQEGFVKSFYPMSELNQTIVYTAEKSQLLSVVEGLLTKNLGRFLLGFILVFLGVVFYLNQFFKQAIHKIQMSNTETYRSQTAYKSLVENLNEAIYVLNPEGYIEYASSQIYTMTGFTAKEVIGKAFLSFVHPEDIKSAQVELDRALQGNKETQDYRFLTRNKRIIWLRTTLTPIYESGELIKIQGILYDVTQQKLAQDQILYLSFHDHLTGIYNRRYIEDAMQRLDTKRNMPFTVMAIDVNGLKIVNDTKGHVAGDLLIKQTADVLTDVCRSDDIIGRIGGDEFMILLPKTTGDEAYDIKERLLEAAQAKGLSLAIGYCVKNKVEYAMEAIIKGADAEMYRHKRNYK